MDRSIYAKSKQIAQLYIDGLNCREIAQMYNSNFWTIRRILQLEKIQIRNNSESKIQYKLNQNYFDNIDTHDKAYFLGFLFADGHNHRPNNNITLSLKESDKSILDQLSKLIFIGQKPIHIYETNEYKRATLQITNKHVSETLEKIGMIQNKTYECRFPQLPQHLIRHFIRGYFDGDGSINFSIVKSSGRRSYKCSFIGTKYFITELYNILKMNGLKPNIEKKFYDKTETVQKLYFHSIPQSIKLFNFMYQDANLFLQRKYNIFQDLFEYVNNLDNLKCIYCNNKVFGKNLCYQHLDMDKRKRDPNYTRSKKVDILLMNEMLQAGKTKTHIANFFGVSISALCKLIKKRKLG